MTIAIIVPVYKHSVLLFDAIASIWGGEQQGGLPLDCDIVIMDDGCPDPGTLIGGLGLAALSPRIHYLRGDNRGLSGARNRGIEFVLAALPDAGAVFFLDADNMLSPWSLRQMTRVLADHPEADWFYPDIRMFGLEWNGDYTGPYTVLAQSLANICEAGSLVRRRVFEAGLRFSEAMRRGLEDWDFWLSAVEAGFRGRHFPESGFRYRKRPESMLADSNRDAAAIRLDLENRHPWMRDLRTMLALEHAECPRYAIYFRDLHVVRLTSSAEDHTEEMTWSDYVTRFWRAARAPNAYHSGAMLIVATSLDAGMLTEAELWHWTLSDLELRLRDSSVASITIRAASEGQLGIEGASNGPDPAAAICAMSTKLLREIVLDATDDWIASIDTPQPAPRVSRRDVVLPEWALTSRPHHGALQSMVEICRELRRSGHAESRHLPAQGMHLGSPDRSRQHQELREKFGRGLLPPSFRYDRPEIGIVLPIVEFGGVEKVAICLASALKALGYGVTLIVLKARHIHLAAAAQSTFDRIIFMDNPEFQNWSGPEYRGTNLPRWSTTGDHADEMNHFSIFDVIISAHAGDVLGLMGELRRRGVVTASHVHLFDRSSFGRDIGHPMLAVAYEHALDLIIGCSRRICADIHALGVPQAKIAVVQNAPTIEISPARAERVRATRRQREAGCLNVLFLGRLDRQKGLDRLIALHQQFSGDPSIRFRIIGKSVIDENMPALPFKASVEDPLYEPHDLLAAYTWADVLVLPSLYEGLPLTLLEAMSLGVVPIAAETGAVDEAIHDNVDGWIVSQEHCVVETTARIELLRTDRARLRAMSDAAVAAMKHRDWHESVKGLDEMLMRLIGERGRDRSTRLPALLPHTVPDAMPGAGSPGKAAYPRERVAS